MKFDPWPFLFGVWLCAAGFSLYHHEPRFQGAIGITLTVIVVQWMNGRKAMR